MEISSGRRSSESHPSEAIKAFVRVRPPISSEISHENCIQVPTTNDIQLKSEKYEIKCKYDFVFNELSTQEEVFKQISPLLDDVLLGYNASIFAYGQTSAGKTHTMLGPNGGQDLNIDKSDWGVIPRAAEYLFSHLQNRSDAGGFKYIAKASFLQIYNEKLFDLLRNTSDDTELKIREIPHPSNSNHKLGNQHQSQKSARKSTKGSYLHNHSHSSQKRDHGSHANHPCEVFITGLSEFRIQTTDDILRVIRVGTHSRATRSTNSNLTSSRSHAILQLTFEMESIEESGQKMIYKSKLSLIDLAGSEKMVALGNVAVLPSSEHLKELTAINQSLSSLGNVISALASKHRPHIPYRDSKLTRILQDSLGGNTRTILLSCVTPSMLHATETISTLQFTDRAKNVMIKSKANLVIDDKSLLHNAQSEISRLKLLLKQALMKIESMTRGEVSNNSTEKSGGERTKIHYDDDGETNEEVDRVIKENKQLRKENQMLMKELKDIREAEEIRRRNARERDRERDRDRRVAGMVTRDDRHGGNGYKREWNLRDDRYFVGDERRKKKSKERVVVKRERFNLPAVNRSQTSPMKAHAPHPVPHPPPNLPSTSNNSKEESETLPSISPVQRSSEPETYSLPLHRQYKIREALGLDVNSTSSPQENKEKETKTTTQTSTAPATTTAIGSPSKSSLDRLRNEYFTPSESPSPSGENRSHEDDDDEEGEFDVKKLREKLQKVQNSSQLKEVEKSLNEATKNIVSQLEIDERSLADIRKSRKDLEKQLQELKSQEEEEEESENEDIESKQNEENQLTPNTSSKSLSATTSTPQFIKRQSSLSRLQTRDELQSAASSSTSPSSLLRFDRGDVGKRMELYIYRYNCWEVIEVVDYEPSKGLHKCRHLDKSEQWIDLKKKQFRDIK